MNFTEKLNIRPDNIYCYKRSKSNNRDQFISYDDWLEDGYKEMLEMLIEIVDGGFFHEVNTQKRYEDVIEKRSGNSWSELKALLGV